MIPCTYALNPTLNPKPSSSLEPAELPAALSWRLLGLLDSGVPLTSGGGLGIPVQMGEVLFLGFSVVWI